MNRRLRVLTFGELERLNKYNVFSISLLVAFIWGVVLFLIKEDFLVMLLPFILLMDATLMSVMYIGSVNYFERSESTISTMLVTPSKKSELVLSKVLANTIHNLFSSSVIIIVFYIFRNDVINMNLGLMFVGIVGATMFFTIAGLCLSYFQKDFTGMLVSIFVISFTLLVPSILYMFGVLEGDVWKNILLINPIQSAQNIIVPPTTSASLTYEYYVGLVYMYGGGILLYVLYALPKFQEYAIKQSGV